MLGYSLRSAAGNKQAGFSKDQFEIKLHFVTLPQFSGTASSFTTHTLEPSLNNETVITSLNTVDKSAPYVLDYSLPNSIFRTLTLVEIKTMGVPLPDTEVFPTAAGISFTGKYKKKNVNMTDSADWTSIRQWNAHVQRRQERPRRIIHSYMPIYLSISQLAGSTEAEANYRIYSWGKGFNNYYGTQMAVHMRTSSVERASQLTQNNGSVNFYKIGLKYADHHDDYAAKFPGAGGLHMWDCSMIHPDLKFYWSQ
jgi:hypothetical protein